MSYLKQYVFLSDLIPFLKKSVQNETVQAKKTKQKNKTKKQNKTKQNYFRVGELKGGPMKSDFPQIKLSSNPFKTNFMSWDIDLGSMNSFSLLKLKFRFLLFEKRSFWSILGCASYFFSFDGRLTLTLGQNSNFKFST